MNRKQVTPGHYWYSMPHWSNPHMVLVEEIEGHLYVRFHAGYSPMRLSDIPANALFEPANSVDLNGSPS